MSGPNDVDRLLHDWDDVASTAKPPGQDPRRSMRSTSAVPVSMLLVAAVAIAVVAIVGRPGPGPTTGDASPSAIAAAPEPVTGTPGPSVAPSPLPTPFAADGVDQDDRFRLTLTTDRTTYVEGNPIDALAAVTFLGPEDEVLGSHPVSPIWFSVTELGGAGRTAGNGGGPEPCMGTTYPRDEAVEYPWAKSGMYVVPITDEFLKFYLGKSGGDRDPTLRLPVGRWLLASHWSVIENGCRSDQGASHDLTAEVIVDVVSPTPTPSPVDVALTDRGVADDDRFQVELTSDGTTYQEGDTIGASATVTFFGPEGSVEVGHGSPPVTFVVEEIGGTRTAGGGADMVCLHSTYTRDEAVPFPWERSGGYSTSNPSANDMFAMEYLNGWTGAREGQLRLPAGTWRLSASLDVAEGECAATVPVTASVVIRVDPDVAATPGVPSPTPRVRPSPPTRKELLTLGPVVRCDRITVDTCEEAANLVAESDPDGYAAAEIVVIADNCPPSTLCDREYSFDATAMLIPPGGSMTTSPAHAVRGHFKPAEVLIGEGDVRDWMQTLVDEAEQLVPIPMGGPSRPSSQGPGPHVCLMMRVGGTLAIDDKFGLVFSYEGRTPIEVLWPFGYSRDDTRGPGLVDATGNLIAVVGDQIDGAGGMAAPGVVGLCPGFAVVKP